MFSFDALVDDTRVRETEHSVNLVRAIRRMADETLSPLEQRLQQRRSARQLLGPRTARRIGHAISGPNFSAQEWAVSSEMSSCARQQLHFQVSLQAIL